MCERTSFAECTCICERSHVYRSMSVSGTKPHLKASAHFFSHVEARKGGCGDRGVQDGGQAAMHDADPRTDPAMPLNGVIVEFQKIPQNSHSHSILCYISPSFFTIQFAFNQSANMSAAREIPVRNGNSELSRQVSNSFDRSASLHSTSPVDIRSPGGSGFGASKNTNATKALKPFHTQDIKVLLLENVNKLGQQMLKDQGYQVEAIKSSLPEDQLIEKIKSVRHTTV